MGRNERGDTLVEVLLSMIVLSVVLVGASTIINTGMRNALNAVEHTQVRNVIGGQGELLRYLRDSATPSGTDAISSAWKDIQNNFTNANAASDTNTCEPAGGKQAFYVDALITSASQPPTITIKNFNPSEQPETYALPGKGMWIEAVRPAGVNPPYIDFHIRACWGGLGASSMQQSNTIVRLYAQ